MCFELALNEYIKLSASRTAAGRLFHTAGPASEKVLSPNFVLVRATVVAAATTAATPTPNTTTVYYLLRL